MKWKARFLLLAVAFALHISVSAQDFTFITNGLVAYYPLNGNANDATSNLLNGTTSIVTYTTNRFGFATNAALLNGHTSAISIPYSTNFNFAPTGQFSLTAWFRLDGFGSGSGGIGSLVVKSPVTGGWDFGLECGLNNNEVPWAGLNNEYACIAVKALDNGEWYQSVLTYSNANWSLYLNGSLLTSATTSFKITQSGGGIAIGRKGDAANDYFDGAIDDVRIYNRALSASEVQQLYNLESNPLLSLAQAVELSFYAVNGVTYQIQNSADLKTWHNLGAPIPGNGQGVQQFYPTHGTTNGPYFRAIVTP